MKINKGSIMMEYVALITIVAAALMSMNIYVKRSVCGRWRDSADSFSNGRQYNAQEAGAPRPIFR